MNNLVKLEIFCTTLETISKGKYNLQSKVSEKELYIELLQLKLDIWGLERDFSMFKNISCSSPSPDFKFQVLYDNLQPSRISAPRYPTPSSGLVRQQACIWYTDTDACKTPINRKQSGEAIAAETFTKITKN